MITLATIFLTTFCLVLITPIAYAFAKKITKKAILKAFLNEILRFGLKAAFVIGMFIAVDGFIFNSPETATISGVDYTQLFIKTVNADQNISQAQPIEEAELPATQYKELDQTLSQNIQ